MDNIDKWINFAKTVSKKIASRCGLPNSDIDDLLSDGCLIIAGLGTKIDSNRTEDEKEHFIQCKIKWAIVESASNKVRDSKRLPLVYTEFIPSGLTDGDTNRTSRISDIVSAISLIKNPRVKSVLTAYFNDGGYKYNKYIAADMGMCEASFSRDLRNGIIELKKITRRIGGDL